MDVDDPNDDARHFSSTDFWASMTSARWALRHGSEALRGAYESILTLYRCLVALSRLIMSNRRRVAELEANLRALAALLPPRSRRQLHFPDP